MREILFRAKHGEKWIEGLMLQWGRDVDPQHKRRLFLTPDGYSFPMEVDPETVCQYTGYTDLRKKKAFEHNIVFCEDNGHYGHIVFKEGQFLIEWGKLGDHLRRDIHFWFTERRLYIVGNIFDNPDLIGEKD